MKMLDRRMVTILLIVLVQMIGSAMILPILPLYAQSEFEMEPQVITLLGTTFFAAQFIGGPFLGRLSDRVGRLPVLLVSQVGTAVSFLILALAPNAAFLFFARLLDGITGGNIVVAQAYITDITPEERRTESLGLIFAAFGVGFIIGPALGGVLAAFFGPRVPYIIAAIAATIVVILTRQLLEESLTPEVRATNAEKGRDALNFRAIWASSALVLVLFIAFLGQFGVGLLQGVYALFGEAVIFAGQPDDEVQLGIGLILTVVGISQVVTQVAFIRPLLERFGEVRLVLISAFIRGIAMALFAFSPTVIGNVVAGIFFALGSGLLLPSLQGLATKAAHESIRGGILGVFQSVSSLGIIMSTAIAGTLFAITPALPFWIGAVLMLSAMLPLLFLLPREKELLATPK